MLVSQSDTYRNSGEKKEKESLPNTGTEMSKSELKPRLEPKSLWSFSHAFSRTHGAEDTTT